MRRLAPTARRLAAPLLVLAALIACAPEQSLEVTATAYNSLPAQTDAEPTIAAWGDRLEPGTRAIAVSPDLVRRGLERGTEVEIEGLDGSYTVLDKTAGRLERHVDIYMGEDVERARQWGVRTVRLRW